MQQSIVTPKQRILELERELNETQTAEREKQLALEEVARLRGMIDSLLGELEARKIELEEAKLERNRARAEAEEARKLKAWKASTLAICAIPWTQALDAVKLAWITSPEQIPYSASVHGGPEDVQITSMKQWNIAIGGNPDNTNKLGDAVKVLEAGGAIHRTPVDCKDGKSHFSMTVDENMLHQPRMFRKEDAPNPHNGGDKRMCPNCKTTELRHNVRVTYECPTCGIDYDRDLTPIVHDRVTTQEPTQEPVPVPLVVQPHQVGTIPRCKHFICMSGSNRTQWKLNGYYCPVHKGWIDEKGNPL